MKEVLQYLKENPVFYLATCEGNQPHVRPFGAVAEYEGKLYIVTGNQKKCYMQMKNNSKIEICTTGTDGTWLRIECNVIHDNRRQAREEMMKQNFDTLSKIYTVDDNIMEVFYLQDATATFYSFTEEPRMIKF